MYNFWVLNCWYIQLPVCFKSLENMLFVLIRSQHRKSHIKGGGVVFS